MKKLHVIILLSFIALTFLIINSCNILNLDPISSKNSNTGTIILKVTAKNTASVNSNGFPVPGGFLQINSANVHIGNIVIEENTSEESEGEIADSIDQDDEQFGFDGEQEGEHDDGDEEEDNDIILQGPYALDISDSEAEIATIDVNPGTYRKVDFTFFLSSDSLFNGKSILINGVFIPDNGVDLPFVLKSEYSDEVQCMIADSGITVEVNTVIPIVVLFDLAGWLGSVDFSSSQISNGQIVVDNITNQDLLTIFEGNLARTVEADELDGDNDEQDPFYYCSITVPDPEPEDLSSLAQITPEQAIQAALIAYPGTTVIEVELDNENGCLVYSIELSNGLDVKVDAGNGDIVHVESGGL